MLRCVAAARGLYGYRFNNSDCLTLLRSAFKHVTNISSVYQQLMIHEEACCGDRKQETQHH